MKNNYIAQGWLILLLGILFGSSLAGVQMSLSGLIDKNKLADTMTQIPNLVPGATTGTADHFGNLLVYKADNKDGKQVGWVAQAAGQGFADKIEVLIGLNMKLTDITGLYILSQNETPGLGNKIVDSGPGTYRSQFNGKPTAAPLTVTKNNDASPANEKIDAITGATISSESVVDIVNKTVETFKAEQAHKEG